MRPHNKGRDKDLDALKEDVPLHKKQVAHVTKPVEQLELHDEQQNLEPKYPLPFENDRKDGQVPNDKLGPLNDDHQNKNDQLKHLPLKPVGHNRQPKVVPFDADKVCRNDENRRHTPPNDNHKFKPPPKDVSSLQQTFGQPAHNVVPDKKAVDAVKRELHKRRLNGNQPRAVFKPPRNDADRHNRAHDDNDDVVQKHDVKPARVPSEADKLAPKPPPLKPPLQKVKPALRQLRTKNPLVRKDAPKPYLVLRLK